MLRFDPPRAHAVSPPITRTKKGAAKRGKSHRGAQKRTRGIVRNCTVFSKARANQINRYETMSYAPDRLWTSDANCHFGPGVRQQQTQLGGGFIAEPSAVVAAPGRTPAPAPFASHTWH